MNEFKINYICLKQNLPNKRGDFHEDEKVTGKQLLCLAGNLSTPSNDISLKVMLSIGKDEACTAAAWDYTLKIDVSNSDFLDYNPRIRNNSFGMWNGGARMWGDKAGIWDGGSGVWNGGTEVRDGGSGMSRGGAEVRDGGSWVWDRCPKAWTFNTNFEVNRTFLHNSIAILKN